MELVRLKVDVIVANVTQASLAAKRATGTIPIAMVAVGDPLESGLAKALGVTIPLSVLQLADEVIRQSKLRTGSTRVQNRARQL